MAWIFPRLGRDDENRIYLSVKNVDTNVLSVGHAAHFYYYMTSNASTQSEYAVTHAPTAATLQLPPALFAGIVANKAIQYGEYGKVQQYGQHDAVVVSNVSTDAAPPFDSTFLTAAKTAAAFTNAVLRPLAGFANEHGVSAANGYMGVVLMNTAVTAGAAHDYRQAWPGGYAVPLSNPTATCTTNSSGTLKAFIKCL